MNTTSATAHGFRHLISVAAWVAVVGGLLIAVFRMLLAPIEGKGAAAGDWGFWWMLIELAHGLGNR